MRCAVFSDVHGNIHAFRLMLNFLSDKSIDKYLCLGDVVGYGPYNDECLELLYSLPVIYLKGNHEQIFIDHNDDKCSTLAKQFNEISFKYFSKLNLIKDLPLTTQIGEWVFCHELVAGFITKKTVVGHFHRQFIQVVKGDYLVCCGSVGQSRTNSSHIEFLIFDTSLASPIQLFSIGYDLDIFLNDLKKYGYPLSLIDYYKSKNAIIF